MRPEEDLFFFCRIKAFQPLYIIHFVTELQLGTNEAGKGWLVVCYILVFLLDTLLFYSKLGRSLVFNVCKPSRFHKMHFLALKQDFFVKKISLG